MPFQISPFEGESRPKGGRGSRHGGFRSPSSTQTLDSVLHPFQAAHTLPAPQHSSDPRTSESLSRSCPPAPGLGYTRTPPHTPLVSSRSARHTHFESTKPSHSASHSIRT